MTKALLKVPGTFKLLFYSFRCGKIKAQKEAYHTETQKGQSVKDNEGLRSNNSVGRTKMWLRSLINYDNIHNTNLDLYIHWVLVVSN